MKLFILFSFLLMPLFPQPDAYANTQVDVKTTIQPRVDTKESFNYDVALKTSQDAIGRVLGNYSFVDANGRSLTIEDFRGKPLILSMVYTSCYQICPMTTRHLAKVVEKARDALGEETFAVAVVGFDTAVDTPDAMQYFANKQGIHNKNWHLLSTSKKDALALSNDTGFLFYPSVSGFDHLIQASIIDAEGKVYRQVYGQVFDTPLLVEPLKELILGLPQKEQTFFSELGNKIKLFCTVYDPVRDGYYFDYSLFIGIFIGAMIIFLTAVFIVKEWRSHNP